ncbi:MAG: hypothetical protein WC490_04840 [Candidatus Margulisiibacteriota bacterium]
MTINFLDMYGLTKVEDRQPLYSPKAALDRAGEAVAAYKSSSAAATVPFDVLLKTAPENIERLSSELERDKGVSGSTVERAGSSLKRLEETVHLRADLQAGLLALKKKGVPDSDPRVVQVEGLIKRLDGHLQKEAAHLNALAKEDPRVAAMLKEAAGPVIASRARASVSSPLLWPFTEDEEEYRTFDYSGLFSNYQSPYGYWLDKELQAHETEKWLRLVEDINRNNERSRKNTTRYLVQLEEDPLARSRLAIASIQKET